MTTPDQPDDLDRLIADNMRDPNFARAFLAGEWRERRAAYERGVAEGEAERVRLKLLLDTATYALEQAEQFARGLQDGTLPGYVEQLDAARAEGRRQATEGWLVDLVRAAAQLAEETACNGDHDGNDGCDACTWDRLYQAVPQPVKAAVERASRPVGPWEPACTCPPPTAGVVDVNRGHLLRCPRLRRLAAGEQAQAGAVEASDEAHCHRCHGPNTPWSAPSPLWNEVMRGGSINGDEIFDGIVCPTCFAIMAEERGIAQFWRLTAQRVHVELETVTPSGRTWDEQAFRWRDAEQPENPNSAAWRLRELGYPHGKACTCDDCPARDEAEAAQTQGVPQRLHCAHWLEGDGSCCRCGEPNWCPAEAATAAAEARFEQRKRCASAEQDGDGR